MAWRHLDQNEETPLMVILCHNKQLCKKSELKSKKWKTELNSAKGFSAINASKLQLLGRKEWNGGLGSGWIEKSVLIGGEMTTPSREITLSSPFSVLDNIPVHCQRMKFKWVTISCYARFKEREEAMTILVEGSVGWQELLLFVFPFFSTSREFIL